MSVDTVPYNFADECADCCSFLFYTHFVNACLEDGQQLTHHVKFDIAESVLGSQCFQFMDPVVCFCAFLIQLLNTPCYLIPNRAVA